MTKGDPLPGRPGAIRQFEQEHEAARSLMGVFSRFGSKYYAYKFELLGKECYLSTGSENCRDRREPGCCGPEEVVEVAGAGCTSMIREIPNIAMVVDFSVVEGPSPEIESLLEPLEESGELSNIPRQAGFPEGEMSE
jgi:hypothetical protein